MKSKKMMTAVVAMAMAAAMSITSFAAGWQKNDNGWWYGTNADNSTWHTGSWQWIDGNGDGIAESYYFDQNGYLIANTTTADGFMVNADGAWVLNGVVQTKLMAGSSGGSGISGGGGSSGSNNSSLTEDERAVAGLYGDSESWLGSHCEVSVLEDGSLKTIGWTDYTDPVTTIAPRTGYKEWTQTVGNTKTIVTFPDSHTMSLVQSIPPNTVLHDFLYR